MIDLPLSRDHPGQHIESGLEDGRLHVQGLMGVILGGVIELPGQGEGFLGPNMRQHVHSVGGQQLQRGNLPKIPPVVPIGGPGEAGVVITKISAVEEIGAVGEDDVVVLAQALFSERRRGDEENGAGAEAEEEGRAVSP